MNPLIMSIVLAIAMTALTFTLSVRFALLSKLGRENRLNHLGKRFGAVLRIGFGQSKLAGRKKERSSGLMHAFIFWGAMIIGLREFIVIGEGFVPGFQDVLPLVNGRSIGGYLYALAYNISEVVVLAMLLWALYRRKVTKPHRLDINLEGNLVLYFIIGIMVTDLVFDAAKFNLVAAGQAIHYLSHPAYGTEMDWMPFAAWLALPLESLGAAVNEQIYLISYWVHIVVALVFANYLPYTKQFHEMTALPNVFFGPVDGPHAPIKLLDLEDEDAWEKESLGLNRIEQLTWKQGLDVYSCTECGRCFDICPTYVTRKPLTMKWVNDALRGELNAETKNILKSGKSSDDKALVGDVIRHDTLWACTTCRACEEVCPVSIEHVPRIIAMRQGQTLMHENYPKELNSAFKGLEQNGNPWNLGYDQRADWKSELEFDLPILTETPQEPYDVLMWVGCMGAFDKRNQKIARATATLMHKAGVKAVILGTKEKCTGDLARRSGNEMLYQTLAMENVESLNGLGVKEVVTNCPHCLNSLKNEYPQLEGKYVVYHHTQYIAKLVDEGRLKLKPSFEGKLTFHDPCYLGRYNGEYDAPRALLGMAARNAPQDLVEMSRSRNEGFCCGAGGARMWMEENQGSRVNEERVRQAAETGATTIATACPFCMTMVGDGVRQSGREDEMEVLDVAEIVLRAVQD